MLFSYSNYYFHVFFLPVALGLFFSLLLTTSVFSLIKNKANESLEKIFVKILFIGAICTTLISICAKDLFNGGIYLYSEKETDAVVEIGTIESIKEPSKAIPSFKMPYKEHQRHGADVIIDGEQYFMVTCEGFEVGDYVEIEYLPKSKFVLSIYEAEPPSVESDAVD